MIRLNGNRLQDVGEAVEGTDAVNLNQLNRATHKLSGEIDDAYAGIAAIAAMTSVPELQAGANFGVGVGVGNFKGAQSVAVGAQARINSNVAVKASVGISQGQVTTG
ncbi:YadA C-terminal domain-containing protein, partial [Pseudomonas viridiflava]|uniref:YadA C-terminal domain-containing protein n=1 Tax=Pseudomonas viridiflava TaxID=33069 RepID=UPI0013DF9A99